MNILELQIRIAKDKAVSIPDEKERIKAFKWIKIIENNTEKSLEKTKAHILNLLTICLQRKMLVGPFQNPPQSKKTLRQLRVTLQPEDIAKLILQKEIEQSDRPPVAVEVNGDLCEYVAFQDIPFFGGHFFYAFSPEIIKNWSNVDASIIPRGLLTLTSISTPDTSILAKNLKDTIASQEKDLIDFGDSPVKKTTEFKNISVLQDDGQFRAEFVNEEPIVKDLNLNLLQGAIARNMLKKDQISGKEEFRNTSLEGPHIAKIEIKAKGKTSNRTDEKNVTQQHKSLIEKVEGPLNWVESREEYDARCKKEMVDKMPPKLQARMKEQEGRKAAAMQKAVEKAEKHKKEMAKKQEEAEKLLKYRFKPKKTKCVRPKPSKKASKHDVLRKPSKETRSEEVEAPVRERNLLQRLENLKKKRAKRAVFDDADKAVETEDTKFEMFVAQELQGANRQAEAAYESDVRDEGVEDKDIPTYEDLGRTEMLLDNAMLKTGRFKEDEIGASDIVYKEVTLADAECEGDKIKPKKGGLVYGKRRLEIPGFEPMEQTYIEEIRQPRSLIEPGSDPAEIAGPLINFDEETPPPASGTVLDKVLNEAFRKLGPGDTSPRLYGQWGEKQDIGIELQDDIEVSPPDSQEVITDCCGPEDRRTAIMESDQDEREMQNLQAASYLGLEPGSIKQLQNTVQHLTPNDCDKILDKTLKSLVHARDIKDIQETTKNVAVLLGEEVDGSRLENSLDGDNICARLTKIRGKAFKKLKKSIEDVVDFYDLVKDFDPLYRPDGKHQEKPPKVPSDVLKELGNFYGVQGDLSKQLSCLDQGALRQDKPPEAQILTPGAMAKSERADVCSPGANRQTPGNLPICPSERLDNMSKFCKQHYDDVSNELSILGDDELIDNFDPQNVQSPVPVHFIPMPPTEPILSPQEPDIYNLEGPINTSSEQILIARAIGQTDKYHQLKTTMEIKRGKKNKSAPLKPQTLSNIPRFGGLGPLNDMKSMPPPAKPKLPETHLKIIKSKGKGKEVLIKKSSISRPHPKAPKLVVTPATQVPISNRPETPVKEHTPKLRTMKCIVSGQGKTVSRTALLGTHTDTAGRKSITKKQVKEAYLPDRYNKDEYNMTVKKTASRK